MPEISQPCWHCGQAFTGRPNRQYCGEACRKAAYRLRVRARWIEARIPRERALLSTAMRRGDLYMSGVHRARLRRLVIELQALQRVPVSVPETVDTKASHSGTAEGPITHNDFPTRA